MIRPSNELRYFELIVVVFVIGLMLLMSSCCPKINSQSLTTVRVDTVTIYHTDTIIAQSTDTFQTSLNIDSLLNFLNSSNSIKKVLSSTTHKGVTTSLSIKDGRLVCQSTVDSLQVVIDSLETIVIKTDSSTVITNTVYKCDNEFHKFTVRWYWGSLILFVLGTLAWAYFKKFRI